MIEQLNENKLRVHKTKTGALRKYRGLLKMNGVRNKHEKDLLDHVERELARRVFVSTTADRKPKNLEETTNCVGGSSTIHGTGAIDTFDPLLMKQKLKRFKDVIKQTKTKQSTD